MQTLKRLLCDKDGATSIEYSLIGALMAIAAITGFTNFSSSFDRLFTTTTTTIDTAMEKN